MTITVIGDPGALYWWSEIWLPALTGLATLTLAAASVVVATISYRLSKEVAEEQRRSSDRERRAEIAVDLVRWIGDAFTAEETSSEAQKRLQLNVLQERARDAKLEETDALFNHIRGIHGELRSIGREDESLATMTALSARLSSTAELAVEMWAVNGRFFRRVSGGFEEMLQGTLARAREDGIKIDAAFADFVATKMRAEARKEGKERRKKKDRE
jgi:hypothetical protein